MPYEEVKYKQKLMKGKRKRKKEKDKGKQDNRTTDILRKKSFDKK
jgi:hypothetical protein